MTSLTEKLSEITEQAFTACSFPAEFSKVRVSDRPDLAQFQCNGAMSAAKAAKKNPRAVAEEVVGRLKDNPAFSKIEIAGPGFINLNITDEYLAAHMKEGVADPAPARGQTVVLDYGAPNVAKPMHVGHLRSSIIGESLKRTAQFAGYKTVGDIHMGDWGTQMGMVISEYIDTGRTAEVLAIDLNDEAAVEAMMEEFSVLYPRVSAQCKEDEARKARALEATVRIQNKDGDYYRLWEVIRAVSVVGMKRNFEALSVTFDLWWGESTAHDTIAPMVEDLRKKGYAVEDDGAVVIPVKRDDDKKEMPPLIMYKRDGAVMYGTTDLACIVDRMREFKPAKIVYVVDQRQNLHFEQLFRAARLTGIAPDGVELTFAGFGTMNGADGKPFKTRAGGVMKLEDLIAMGIEKAKARLAEADLAKDMDQGEKDDIAHKVAIAAIKFADLQNQRQTDYIFDLDRLTAFEGKTGPYLLYQAVRIKSLLRKAGGVDEAAALTIRDEDRSLALLLTAFPDAVDNALNSYAPHHLCDYVYRLAQEFSSFYGNCHILSETDEALKKSRLALCAMTVAVLEKTLDLLGIAVPERM